LRMRASSMSSLLPTHLNKMVWRGRIELYWTCLGPCLMSTRHRTGFGLRRLTPPATPSTGYTFTVSSRRHHMNSSLVKSLMFHILESLEENFLFLLKVVENLNLLPKLQKAFYLVMTQTQGHIESSSNPLRNMSIGDVCPKESEEPPQAQDQPSSSNQASPPTQDED
jgi:hypothetical protein